MLHHVSLEIPPDAAARSAEFWGLLGFQPAEAPAEIAEYVSWFERVERVRELWGEPRRWPPRPVTTGSS